MFRVEDQWFVDLRVAGKDMSFSDITNTNSASQLQSSSKIDFNHTLLQHVTIVESIDQLVPTMEVGYNPHSPFWQEFFPITGMESLLLSISKESPDPSRAVEGYVVLSYTPFSDVPINERQQPFKLECLSSPIKDLLKGKKRSLRGSISDAVERIVKPSTSDTDIEKTHSRLDKKWIQPGWSNAKMLKYLTSKALSREGLAPYFSFFRSDNTFVFKSLDELYSQERKERKKTTWYFATNDNESQAKEEPDDPADNTRNIFVLDFELEYDSFLPVTQGALGFNSSGFNWREGKWEESERDLKDNTKHNTLTQNYLFNDRDFVDSFGSVDKLASYLGRVDGFSDLTKHRADGKVVDANRSIVKLTVTLGEELKKVEIGDKINLNVIDGNVPGRIQQVSSGDWLVGSKIRHIEDNQFRFKYVLFRDGINAPRLEKAKDRFVKGNPI